MDEFDFAQTDAMSRFLDSVLAGRAEPRERSIGSGHRELDETLGGGLRVGSVSLVAGIPGVGTSMFCLGIARRAAVVDRIPTVVIAPDDTEKEIFARIVAAEARIPINSLRSGAIAHDDVVKAQRKRAALVDAPLLVSASWRRPATTQALVASVADWIAHGARFLVIDGTSHAEPHTRELIRALKSSAQGTQTTVLIASKVLMPDDRRADYPVIEDLCEYRSTADLFDLVLSLHRPDMHDWESTRAGEADVEILKHRHGPTRRFAVAFQGHYARFVDLA